MEVSGESVLAGLIPEYFYGFLDELDEHPWLFSALASILVGLSGILPLLIIPIDKTATFKDGACLIIMLAFGSAWEYGDKRDDVDPCFPECNERSPTYEYCVEKCMRRVKEGQSDHH